jgi:hypothetical protein
LQGLTRSKSAGSRDGARGQVERIQSTIPQFFGPKKILKYVNAVDDKSKIY